MLGAAQGLNQIGGGKMQHGRRYEAINYHELIGNLKEEVATLKRQFKHILERLDRVVEADETRLIYRQQLRRAARLMRRGQIIDLDDVPRLK